MKKQIIFLFIVLFVFIVCLSISIIIKHFFGLDGDYLSAFSTLVAAAGAFYLFNDWKDEHKFALIQKTHEDLRTQNLLVIKHLNLALVNFRSVEGSTVKRGEENWLQGVIELRLFITELIKTINKIDEYRSYLSIMKSNSLLINHVENILNIKENLREIQNEFLTRLPNISGGVSQTNDYVQHIIKWENDLSGFKLLSEKELTDFYVNYLNSM